MAATRIAVTGMGAVSAFGWGVPNLVAGLFRGETAIGPFDVLDHARDRTHLAAQVPARRELTARRSRLAAADRFALFAADEALAASTPPVPRRGVFFGSSSAGMREGERWYETLRERASEPPLSLLASQLLGAPAEAVARACGVTGPVQTISSACASGALAIEAAGRALEEGEVDVALAGGSDSLCRIVYSGFNALRAVDAAACRPFRRDRAGLSLGEGAAVLVLERMEDVLASGRRPVAEILGAASTCDAAHMTAPHPQGAGASAAGVLALERAGLDASRIGYVNAHGTGTPLNDGAERHALATLLGERTSRVPVSATKALLGHLLGSAGALEAVATIACLRRGVAHPCPSGGEMEEGIDLVTDVARPLERGTVALSLSLGFGGSNAALLIGIPAEASA